MDRLLLDHRPRQGFIRGISPLWKDIAMQTRHRAVARPPLPHVTFRLLQSQGLTPVEATRLTAFLCGLPTADLCWSLNQINQLVFLRQLYEADRFRGLPAEESAL